MKRLKEKLYGLGAAFLEELKLGFHDLRANKGKSALFILFVLLVILGTGASLVYGKIHSYYEQSNYISEEEAAEITESLEATEEEEEEEEEEEVDEELAEIQEYLDLYRTSENVMTGDNVYNILLIGVDRTKSTEWGRSDSMILISINYENETISMISLMRDTYVYVPDYGYKKLNAAYALGGGELLTETVTENYKVEVDRYMAVSFRDMINIVDSIGTIELTFTEAEAENANTTMLHMCQNLGIEDEYELYEIPGEGTYQCNGLQTVAYARIRKVGNADYQRTERQREVLLKIVDLVRQMSISDIDKLAYNLLSYVTHNVPENEFWSLLGNVPTLLSYDIVSDRVPYDDMYTSQNYNLIPDWDATIEKLQEQLYGTGTDDDTETGEELSDEETDETEDTLTDGTSSEDTAENVEIDEMSEAEEEEYVNTDDE